MGHQFKHQTFRAVLRESISNYKLKMAMNFTFTASIVFIIFSYSSLMPNFLSSSRIYISNLTMFFPGRNYMFFLSNILLAFIVKNSGLISNLSPKENDTNGVKQINKVKKSGGSGSIVSRSDSSVTLETKASIAMKEEEEEEEEEEGTGNGVMIATGEDAATEKCLEEEKIQDEGSELVSIDELNKKCDAFIKMMKGGIQVEVQ